MPFHIFSDTTHANTRAFADSRNIASIESMCSTADCVTADMFCLTISSIAIHHRTLGTHMIKQLIQQRIELQHLQRRAIIFHTTDNLLAQAKELTVHNAIYSVDNPLIQPYIR